MTEMLFIHIWFFGPSAIPEMSLKNNLLENTAAITKNISLVYVFITFFDFLYTSSDTYYHQINYQLHRL